MITSTKIKLKAAGLLGTGLVTMGTIFGCKNSTAAQPKVCECPDPAHLGIGETCDCDGEDCDCTVKVYGQLANGVKIYRSGDVSDTDMATAAANAIAGYDGLSSGPKILLEGKIDEIHILPMTYEKNSFYRNVNGKLVLGFKCEMPSAAIGSRLSAIAEETLLLEVSALKDMKGVKLVKAVSKTIIAEVLQSRVAVSQRLALNRLMMRQRG